MKNRISPAALFCTVGALFSLSSFAQDVPSGAPTLAPMPWTVSATLSEESIGEGLPVLALDRPDWPSFRSGHVASPRAWRSIRAEMMATNPGGWRLAALVRAEASLDANDDTVTLAALDATNSRPDTARSFSLSARGQSWQGRGIRVGTPWLKLDAAERWHWQADTQLLQLQQLRLIELSGDLQYRGGDLFDFNAHSQRSASNITGPFLPPSGNSGLGSSLSVALQGEPAPGWQFQLRADDLLSRLQWSDLATDTAVLNSQVTSRAPDGSLDYAPLIQGKKALRPIQSRIGVHWQAKASWSAFESFGQSGAVTLRADRKANITQYWLGWDSGNAGRNRLHWSAEIEPLRRAASLALVWRGWHALLASDGKGTGSQFRAWSVGWQAEF